jgi:hypothetical protein
VGVTLEQGILGSYPDVRPIPGRTTTFEGPLQIGVILFASRVDPKPGFDEIGQLDVRVRPMQICRRGPR